MRSMPRCARLAIAKLWIRRREAERHASNMINTFGSESYRAIVARAEYTALHNAYVSTARAAWAEHLGLPSPDGNPLPTKEWARVIAHRGRLFPKAA